MSNDQRQPKATIAATYWCKRCRAETLHNVHDGRKAGCQKCIEKLDTEQQNRTPPAEQPKLFN